MRSDSVCGEGLPYLESYSRTVDDQNFKQLGHARDRLSYSQQPRAAVEWVIFILKTSVPQLAWPRENSNHQSGSFGVVMPLDQESFAQMASQISQITSLRNRRAAEQPKRSLSPQT
jgi:hypothetical protein